MNAMTVIVADLLAKTECEKKVVATSAAEKATSKETAQVEAPDLVQDQDQEGVATEEADPDQVHTPAVHPATEDTEEAIHQRDQEEIEEIALLGAELQKVARAEAEAMIDQGAKAARVPDLHLLLPDLDHLAMRRALLSLQETRVRKQMVARQSKLLLRITQSSMLKMLSSEEGCKPVVVLDDCFS